MLTKAEGRQGKLLAGGREVASLGRWKLTRSPQQGAPLPLSSPLIVIQAEVVSLDTYWCERMNSFTVLLLVGSRCWRWEKSEEVVFDKGSVRITVKGSPDSE